MYLQNGSGKGCRRKLGKREYKTCGIYFAQSAIFPDGRREAVLRLESSLPVFPAGEMRIRAFGETICFAWPILSVSVNEEASLPRMSESLLPEKLDIRWT